MVYTRRAIGAAEALSIVLLSEVAPSAQFDAAVARTVATLADRNRAALAAVKAYMNTALYADPQLAASLAANMLSCVFSSPAE
jgi:enoyl-CoA hydratase/carnithine racemase